MSDTKEYKKTTSDQTESEVRKIKIYTAANHYIYVSSVYTDMARHVNVNLDQLKEWMETDEWEEALRFWGYKGKRAKHTRKTRQPAPQVPHTLTEKYLLEEAFPKDGIIRFVTYDGFIDTNIKQVDTYEIVLPDDTTIRKLQILLVFPKLKMPFIKKGIKRRKELADKDLKPILKVSERHRVNVRARRGDMIQCVMRNGLVITGESVWVSKYNIVMRAGGSKYDGGRIIIVYRHALYDFNVLEAAPPPSERSIQTEDPNTDKWDEESMNDN